jgi:formylglycine-generating enzyme required for sulfatase activity
MTYLSDGLRRRLRSMGRASLAAGLVVGMARAAAAEFPGTHVRKCGPDAVVAGTVCLDAYEASVWRVPHSSTTNARLVRRIQLGRATQADLMAAGATELGTAGDDYAPCAGDGQSCADDIYAVSLPSVIPSASITWFQAEEACANAGKRLPTSAEWQVGANGTPDAGPDNGTTDCNTFSPFTVAPTGSRSRCVSARGAFDMVGNLYEWVADWVPRSTTCPGWGGLSDDSMCFSGASTTAAGPGALLRGGDFGSGQEAGPLTVSASFGPSNFGPSIGFRCAR